MSISQKWLHQNNIRFSYTPTSFATHEDCYTQSQFKTIKSNIKIFILGHSKAEQTFIQDFLLNSMHTHFFVSSNKFYNCEFSLIKNKSKSHFASYLVEKKKKF